MNNNLNKLKYVAYAMLSASALLVVLGVYFYTQENAFLKECRLIKCKITNIEEHKKGNAVLTFRDINRNYPEFEYTKTYDPDEEDLDYAENEIHEVYYYSKDVSKSEIKGFFENHITSFILFMVGFAFMLDFPILLFVVARNKKQQIAKNQYGIKDNVISE